MPRKDANGEAAAKRAILLRSTIALIVGLCLVYRYHHETAGRVVLAVACVLALGATHSRLRNGLDRLEKALAHAIGTVLTVALLVPFFYLCIFPGRLILLLTGKDPLNRTLNAGETSYWTPIDKTSSREQYRRQS